MRSHRQLAEELTRSLPSTPTVEDMLIAAFLRVKTSESNRYFTHLGGVSTDEGVREQARIEASKTGSILDRLRLVPSPERSTVLNDVVKPILDSEFDELTERDLLLLESTCCYNDSLLAFLTTLQKKTGTLAIGRMFLKGVPHKVVYKSLFDSCMELSNTLHDLIDYRKHTVLYTDSHAIEHYRSKAITAISVHGEANSKVNKHVAMDWSERLARLSRKAA
ncbi:hypothetical protein VCHA53O466_140056 [Vibrio chagasii]|nr:hypothetical protein VCHA53O466_140056 [Vibrio chagasii]